MIVFVQDLGEGRRVRRSTSSGTTGSSPSPVVRGGDEVLDRAGAALDAGALDPVDRERERVALLAGVGHGLVGDADDDQVGLLAARASVVGRPADWYSGFGSNSSGRLLPGNIGRPGEPMPSPRRGPSPEPFAELAVEGQHLHVALPLGLLVHVLEARR